MIQENYIITEKTLAIVSIRHHAYSTKVYEIGDSFYVKEPPNRIVKNNLERTFQSMEVQRKLIGKKFSYKQRIPVMTGIHIPVFLFPTTGDRNPNISWLTAQHIISYKSYQQDQMRYTDVTFSNGTVVTVKDISHHTLHKQKRRTQAIIDWVHKEALHERWQYFHFLKKYLDKKNRKTYQADVYTFMPNTFKMVDPFTTND